MKRKWLSVVSLMVFVTAVALSGTAFAEKQGAAPAEPQFKKKTVYDFEDDVVEGELLRPDGEYINMRPNFKHSSLIKIRQDFINELVKSAEDI